MQITRGKVQTAQKVVIYGPEGIGKSTFASQFPNAVFIDTEGSTKHLDVARLPKPSSWSMLLEEVRYVKSNPHLCNTLVIDTADWAEQLCAEEICAKYKKTGIEDFGYGKGYIYLSEEFGRLLNLLEEVIERGINVVFTAHAQMRKFEQPDEMGSYDRWEMKLEKKTAPLMKEWADMILFANYKTYVIKTDDKKNKAQGGNRVMYTSHHACWDAKNRHSLKEELDFKYSEIAHCITVNLTDQARVQPVAEQKEAPKPVTDVDRGEPARVSTPQPSAPASPVERQETKPDPKLDAPAKENAQSSSQDLTGVPKPLADLMQANGVTVAEIQKAVSHKGYYPQDTPIARYDPSFITGVLVAAWPQVFNLIKELRELPF